MVTPATPPTGPSTAPTAPAPAPTTAKGFLSRLKSDPTYRKIMLPLMFIGSLAPVLLGAAKKSSAESPSSTRPVATSPQEAGSTLTLEDRTESMDSGLRMPRVETTFVRTNETGDGLEFNPLSLVAPIQIAVPVQEQEKPGFWADVPYEFARQFNTGEPLTPEDHERLAAHIHAQLQEQLADQLKGFEFSKAADRAVHGAEVLHDMRLTNLEIAGYTSPEGPDVRGPETISSSSVDTENLRLGVVRAVSAGRLTLEQMEALGIDTSAVRPADTTVAPQELGDGDWMILAGHLGYRGDQIDQLKDEVRALRAQTAESQFSAEETQTLAELAASQPGNDVETQIWNLIRQYNLGHVDAATKAQLDELVGSKRRVEITATFEGERTKTFLIPLPLLLLLIPKIQREKKTVTEEEDIYERTAVDDILPHFDRERHPEKLSYRRITEWMDDTLRDLEAKNPSWTPEQVKGELIRCATDRICWEWEENDRYDRQVRGLPPIPMNYKANNYQRTWAAAHAELLLRVIQMKRTRPSEDYRTLVEEACGPYRVARIQRQREIVQWKVSLLLFPNLGKKKAAPAPSTAPTSTL